MQEINSIQYLCDRNIGIELILCIDSEISYPVHNHVSVLTIGLILRGSIFLTAGENHYTCRKGSSFTILPYVPHSIEAQGPYSLLTLCISKNAVSNYSKDEIKNNICHLLAAASEVELTDAQTFQLLHRLDSLDNPPLSYPVEPFIDSAKNQIERCPETKLSIGEMARSLHISKYHFIRCFKRAVGLTPHQFQIQNRVRKAQHILNTVDNIAEVALIAGFCDQSHLIKYFERYVGLKPTVYRLSCKLLP